MFARIRAELAEEIDRYNPRLQKGTKYRRAPTCCMLGCAEPRPKGEKYCALHEGEQITE
jgi:hypothetical protein